ncbi:MAG: hypothetical protein J6Y78_13185 [Paludibacteraceae bacterium]|jgi:hypothetical protein|nr:hypothetical protein [Paludibacteraceae bacterium]
MKKLKVYDFIVLMMMTLFLGTSCSYEYDDEDYLVGDTWQWVESIHYVESRSHWVVDYRETSAEDVWYKFYRNGDMEIRSYIVSHFGRIYEDWIDGTWSLYNGELTMRTYDGIWSYELERISNYEMILVYYRDMVDLDGYVYEEKVEERYVR